MLIDFTACAAGAGVVVHHADCRAILADMPDESVHAVVTDPPYGINLTVGYAARKAETTRHAWDDEIAFDAELWRDVARVMKPGAHLVAFTGRKTYHHIASAIERGGLDIRDMWIWMYPPGMPKGKDVGLLMRINDMPHDAWKGWSIGNRPAFDPIVLARKPPIGRLIDNVSAYGTGAMRDAGAYTGVMHHVDVSVPDVHHTIRLTRRERALSRHPCMKPVALMRHVVRMVTPPGGMVFDPFAGSGATLEASRAEHFACIGIEREASYIADIQRRLGGDDGRRTDR